MVLQTKKCVVRSDELLTVLLVHRDWLLNHDVKSRRQGRNSDCGVEVMRGGNEHGIDDVRLQQFV